MRALLLIATVLAYRSIIEYIVDLVIGGSPDTTVDIVFLVLIIVFGVFFIVIPAIPLVTSIVRAFKEKAQARTRRREP